MSVKTTLYDKLLIVSLLALSLAIFLFNIRLEAGGEQKYISILVNNSLVKEISFNMQTEEIVTFPFGEHNEHVASLQISRGRVRMLPISEDLCPRGICSHIGWISRSYQSIVCVPNRIMVLLSSERTPEFDGITY